MGTVAPVRKLSADEKAQADWYTKLVDWWGFDPLDVAPMMGMAAKGAKKASTVVGKKAAPRGNRVGPIVNDKLLPAARKPPISPTEVTPFEQIQLGLSKGAEPYQMRVKKKK